MAWAGLLTVKQDSGPPNDIRFWCLVPGNLGLTYRTNETADSEGEIKEQTFL